MILLMTLKDTSTKCKYIYVYILNDKYANLLSLL